MSLSQARLLRTGCGVGKELQGSTRTSGKAWRRSVLSVALCQGLRVCGTDRRCHCPQVPLSRRTCR